MAPDDHALEDNPLPAAQGKTRQQQQSATEFAMQSSSSIATGSAAYLPQENNNSRSSSKKESACDDDEHDQEDDAPAAADSIAIENNNNKAKSGDDNNDDDKDKNDDPLKSLHPPPTCMEKARDALLRFLDHAFFQYLGIAVLLGVVVSGAVFFFFLVGWQTLCSIPSKTDCQPRNDIYNVAIQVLTAFFTYMATFSMPWRCVNFLHTVGWHCPAFRCNETGHDLYGLPTDDVWFHIPYRPRIIILLLLLFNCLFQYANQASRIVYYNYELQDEYPGTLWTNLFFVSSMACAAAGGALMAYHVATIRISNPQRFGLGPIDLCKELWRVHVRGKEPRPQRRRETQDANAASSFDDSYESSCHSVAGGGQDDKKIAAIDLERQQQRQESNVESQRPEIHHVDSSCVDDVPVGERPPYRHVSSSPAVMISTAPTRATTEDPHHHHHHEQHHDHDRPHPHYHDPTRSEDPPLTGEQNRGAMRMWAM